MERDLDLWIQELLAQPRITDVCINCTLSKRTSGRSEIFVDRGTGMEPVSTPTQFRQEQIKAWVLNELSEAGKSWDAKYPFIDLSSSKGFRLHVALPPISQGGLTVSIRRLPQLKTPSDGATAEHQTQKYWAASPGFSYLEQQVVHGATLLVGGATGSGKTTLVNELLAAVPHHQRIVCLEDTLELQPQHPHFVSLLSRPPNSDGYGEVTLRTLLKQTLRMRPDRIILGECRGPEVMDLLQALNTGHQGTLATLHANSCREMLRRLEVLCLLSGTPGLTLDTVRELVRGGVHLLCHVARVGKERKILEIAQIEGNERGTILLRPVLNSVTGDSCGVERRIRAY